MKLGNIYVHNKDKYLIQIDSYATHLNKVNDNMIIVYNVIDTSGFNCISFNGYATKSELEDNFSLLVHQTELYKYNSWSEIYNLIN